MTTPGNELLALLLSTSRESQRDAMLRHMANERNLRKQIGELLDEWVDEAWKAALLLWFDEYGPELTEKLKAGPDIFALPKRNPWRALHPAYRRERAKKLAG